MARGKRSTGTLRQPIRNPQSPIERSEKARVRGATERSETAKVRGATERSETAKVRGGNPVLGSAPFFFPPTKPMRFHFVGVCGTLMGSVAAALRAQGHHVTGSDDKVYPPMSDFLAARGIPIASPFAAANLPDDPAAVVVVGNAMSRGNPEVEAVLARRLAYESLPEVLRRHFLRGKRNFVVTGTHGKTTTSSLLAWMLESAGRAPSFVIGGLPGNFGEGARFTASEFCVLEGDEYDTAFFDKRSKFVHYLPECVVINNLEFDHADIFSSVDEIVLSFRRLVSLVPANGLLVVNGDDANVRAAVSAALTPVLPVGLGVEGEGRITAIAGSPEGTSFRVLGENFFTPLAGEFNVRNCAVAAAAARFAGLPTGEIRTALASFKGVKRRQEERGQAGGVRVIDDFGHHPTAIAETLRGLRARHPGARLVALFEPRSNTTRRGVFQQALPAALAQADAAVLAPVVRLDQIPAHDRLDPARVVADIRAAGREAFYAADTAEVVRRATEFAQPGDVVVVFSNGGFDGVHAKLLAALGERVPVPA